MARAQLNDGLLVEMAFDLPRSPRSLRFTGSVRALAKEKGEVPGPSALGRARPNAGPPVSKRSPPLAPPARSVRGRSLPVPIANVTTPTRLTTMRGQMASIDDDVTECLDRDALDIAQLPDARQGKSPPGDPRTGAPNLPVPGFRSKAEVAQQHREPSVIVPERRGGSLPLGVWLFAAMIAGIVSFHFAPQARDSFQEAIRALDSR